MTILEEIAQEYGIPVSALLGGCREKELVEARVAAMKRLEAAGLKVAEIAQVMHRHHSTVTKQLNKGYKK